MSKLSAGGTLVDVGNTRSLVPGTTRRLGVEKFSCVVYAPSAISYWYACYTGLS